MSPIETNPRKERIAASFDAASAGYDREAPAQSRSALKLGELILGQPRRPQPRVLEIGCGTGLLTRRLLPRLGGHWVISDIAPAMVEAARHACGGISTAADLSFRVMDGEYPDEDLRDLDLIVSNFAAQWFTNLPAALKRLHGRLRSGGLLAVATLGHDSFSAWREAHAAQNLVPVTPDYPQAKDLFAELPGPGRIVEDCLGIPYPDGRAFATALKRIGAGTPAPGHAPLSAGALRRVIRALGAPVIMDYHVLHILTVKE